MVYTIRRVLNPTGQCRSSSDFHRLDSPNVEEEIDCGASALAEAFQYHTFLNMKMTRKPTCHIPRILH